MDFILQEAEEDAPTLQFSDDEGNEDKDTYPKKIGILSSLIGLIILKKVSNILRKTCLNLMR